MAPNPNIEKKIYVNNRRWDAVDTNSISGDPIMASGAEPSMIRFNVNRHFDTHKSDYDVNIAVPDLNIPIRHLDNVKLFIAPVKDGFTWPSAYTGRNNYSDTPSADPQMSAMESYLAWQGVYVDPAAAFSLDDGNLGHDESYSVACYDYRWCMHKCRFRVFVSRRTWSSERQGEIVQTAPPSSLDAEPSYGYNYTPAWRSDDDNNVSYEFEYNHFIPQCPNARPRPWVMIVGHIIRQVMVEYFPGDLGTLQKTIPADTGAAFSFSGLLLNEIGAERIFDYSDVDYFFDEPVGNGDYYVDPDRPVAGSDKTERDFSFRGFVPEPISLSGVSVAEAIQEVLDAVGNFVMYIDQWNCLHFERVKAREELALPASTALNASGDLYLCHFLDDDGTPIKSYHNFRGLNIRPRAVPKANRVVGQLRGKAPVTSAIVNTQAEVLSGSASYAHFCANVNKGSFDSSSFVAENSVTQRHFSNKLHTVWGTIRKPVRIVPFIYAVNGIQTGAATGASAVLSTGWMVGSGATTATPVEAAEKVVLPGGGKAVITYRFAVDFAVSPASVSLKETQRSSSGSSDAPYRQLTGGHTVLLTEPAYTLVRVQGKSVAMVDGKPDIEFGKNVQYYAITHSWTARGQKSKHTASYSGNRDFSNDDDGQVCLYGMGVAPNANVFSVDSTVDGPEWDDLREYDDAGVMTFPGKGEYDRSIMTAPVIFADVRRFVASDTTADQTSWSALWANAKTEMAKIVKIAALQFRQLVTTGSLPVFYDRDLRIGHRVCIIGTRDDSVNAMRLKVIFARITAINLTSEDELEIELTDEMMGQNYTLFGSLLSQLKW